MKNIATAILGVYLFFMFLVYSGFFRDNSNPLDITKYYFECLKNHEGFLTYQICMPEFFSEDRYGILYKKYKLNLIDKIKFNLINANDKNSYVHTKIIYKTGDTADFLVTLTKGFRSWLINSINYTPQKQNLIHGN